MSEPQAQRRHNGIVFSITDGEKGHDPVEKVLDDSDAYDWFQAYPQDVYAPILKIISHQVESASVKNGFDIPFSQKIVQEAIWGCEVYTGWSSLYSGGCAALLDDPVRFTLQTPIDGYPFVSLAMSRKGIICKGVMTYDHPEFDPIQMMPGERLMSGWRSEGTQIASLPQAFLKTHSAWLSRTITETLRRLQAVESALSDSYIEDFSTLQRSLHICQDTMLRLERRSQFESVVISAIGSIIKDRSSTALAPAQAAVQLRQADLATIPRRIEIARAAINDRILQRTQIQSLEIAQSTYRIAEATMQDSAAMRTIAILTMVFLPGTAMATFFSMTVWNWDAPEGSSLVNSWIWIYFAVTIPLTLGVMGTWYYLTHIRGRHLEMSLPTFDTQHAPPYTSGSQHSIRKLD